MCIRTDAAEEIDVCRNKLGMTWREIGECDIRAAEAAFVDDVSEKKELIEIITKRVNLWIEKKEKIDVERAEKDRNLRISMVGVTVAVFSFILYRNITRR